MYLIEIRLLTYLLQSGIHIYFLKMSKYHVKLFHFYWLPFLTTHFYFSSHLQPWESNLWQNFQCKAWLSLSARARPALIFELRNDTITTLIVLYNHHVVLMSTTHFPQSTARTVKCVQAVQCKKTLHSYSMIKGQVGFLSYIDQFYN